MFGNKLKFWLKRINGSPYLFRSEDSKTLCLGEIRQEYTWVKLRSFLSDHSYAEAYAATIGLVAQMKIVELKLVWESWLSKHSVKKTKPFAPLQNILNTISELMFFCLSEHEGRVDTFRRNYENKSGGGLTREQF
jgi:uncharacterized protein YecA (UPF0149 family)